MDAKLPLGAHVVSWGQISQHRPFLATIASAGSCKLYADMHHVLKSSVCRGPSCFHLYRAALHKMDTLGFEPRAFRMRSGCDTTTPCAQMLNAKSTDITILHIVHKASMRMASMSLAAILAKLPPTLCWMSATRSSLTAKDCKRNPSTSSDSDHLFFIFRIHAADVRCGNKRHRRDSNPCGQSPMDF